MAVDSAIKRRSAASFGQVWFGPGVTPNATKPQAWRQAAGWGYAGILVGEPGIKEYDWYVDDDLNVYITDDGDIYVTDDLITSKDVFSGEIVHVEGRVFGMELCTRIPGMEIGD